VVRAGISTIADDVNPLDNTRVAVDTVTVIAPEIHDVSVIDVTPSPPNVTVGQNVYIKVTVKNEGNVAENFSVTVYYNDTLLGDAQQVTNLVANTTQELTFTWSTKNAAEGRYIITAQASVVSGETDQDNNRLASSVNVVGANSKPPFPAEIVTTGTVAAFAIIGVALYLRLRRKSPEKPKVHRKKITLT